jgi:hypothetical protein
MTRTALLAAILSVTAVGSAGYAAEHSLARSAARSEYVDALASANQFLGAWVRRDQEFGIELMSKRLRAIDESSDSLRLYMSGLSNPHHAAFEISKGRQLGARRYAFGVTLFERADGMATAGGYSSTIEMVLEEQQWRVDRLPRTPESGLEAKKGDLRGDRGQQQ